MTQDPGSTSGDGRADAPPSYGQPPAPPPGPYGVPPSGAHPVPYGQPAPQQGAYGAYGYPPGLRRHPDQRPGTVLAAAITTIVSTSLVLAMLLVGVVALLVAGGSFRDGLDTAPLPFESGTVYGAIVLVLLALLVWCIGAIVLAVLVLRRSNGARIALVVSSALTIVLSLLAIGGGASVVTLGAATAVIVCLFTGGANDWFHREHLYSPPRPPQV